MASSARHPIHLKRAYEAPAPGDGQRLLVDGLWPRGVSKVELEAEDIDCVRIVARCKLAGQTGVEMEALTAASVAALTIYDMCKAVDRGMCIEAVRLLEKSGGASGTYRAP